MSSNKKISDLPALAGASIATDDLFLVVDVSAPDGSKNKKTTLADLLTAMSGAGAGFFQPLNANLTSLANLTLANNKLLYSTGPATVAQLLLTTNTFPARSSTGDVAAKTVTDFALSLLDDATAAEARTTLGISATVPTLITVANETTDATCNLAFFTAATGDLGPKTNAGLTYDSSANTLGVAKIVGGSGTTSTLTLQPTSGVGTTGADIIFLVGNNGATEGARIKNDGSVGIGVSLPLYRLHVLAADASNATTGKSQAAFFQFNPTIDAAGGSIGEVRAATAKVVGTSSDTAVTVTGFEAAVLTQGVFNTSRSMLVLALPVLDPSSTAAYVIGTFTSMSITPSSGTATVSEVDGFKTQIAVDATRITASNIYGFNLIMTEMPVTSNWVGINLASISLSAATKTHIYLDALTGTGTNRALWARTNAGDFLIEDFAGSGTSVVAVDASGKLSRSATITSSAVTVPKIIGGSGTTQTLTYQTTTGIGAAGADHIFVVGNNGTTEAMRISNSGNVTIAVSATFGGQVVVATGGIILQGTTDVYGSQLLKTYLRMNSSGTNYGTIQNDGADLWSLGTSATGNNNLGTPVLQWSKAGDVQIPSPGTGSASAVTCGGTQTLTNKRNTLRAPAVTQSATPTINTDATDVAHITGLAQAITSMTTNLTGTPVQGDELRIDITDDGTARGITWGAKFEASGTVALPTTTVLGVRLDTFFVWNTVTSKWRIVKAS